ncbi:MAG: CsiV family protein [Gammaproteobacteria bacterium]
MSSHLKPIVLCWLAAFAVLIAPVASLAGASASQNPSHPLNQWVQVIVFRSLDRDAGRHERWGHAIPQGAASTGVDLDHPSHLPSGFHQAGLSPRMRRIWATLKASALYHPILKRAWIQPAYPMGLAIPVDLGHPIGGKISRTGSLTPAQIPSTTRKHPPSVPLSMSDQHFQVLGTVQITVMRHVYIEVHALLVKRNRQVHSLPVSTQASGNIPPLQPRQHRFSIYPINQADQFRPGRVSYFDNPVYGILVYIKSIPKSSSAIPLATGG